jgi:hypothetical protein
MLYYTIEHDDVQQRATASQLRRYFDGGVSTNIHFNDDTRVTLYGSPVLQEASLSNTNNTAISQEYEPIDYSDSDIASEEDVPVPQSRRAPKRFPEGQWTRSVAKVANVNKGNVSDTEPIPKAKGCAWF